MKRLISDCTPHLLLSFTLVIFLHTAKNINDASVAVIKQPQQTRYKSLVSRQYGHKWVSIRFIEETL